MNKQFPYETTSQLKTQPRKRRIRWWLIVSIFAVPFALLALGTLLFRVGWTIRENQGRKAMQVELQRLANEGIVSDNQALSEIYLSRTSEEFSFEWESLFVVLQSPEFAASCSGVPVLDRTVDVDDFADDFDTSSQWQYAETCIRFTQEQSELIAEARRLAVEQQPTYFPIVFLSNETLLPEVQHIRTVAWLLRTDAQVAMYKMDRDRAFADIVALSELSKHVDSVPFVVSRLVGIAVRRLAMQSLQNAIRIDLFDDDQLRQIDGLVALYSNVDDRWKTLIVDEMSTNLPVFVNPNISMKTDTIIPARGHDAVYFIGLMRKARVIETEDWLRFYRSSIELEAELEQGIDSTAESVDRLLSGLFAPAFGSLAAALINDAQLHRQARIAIALRRYQHEQGSLPAELKSLPESIVALKPAGERPFGYAFERGRAVLWGFLLSPETLQTPMQVPDTTQANTASLNNRSVVWWIDMQKPIEESTED
jgi:hypothetical protein